MASQHNPESVYILTASAGSRGFSGRWQAIGDTAYPSHAEASAALEGFIGRCRGSDDGVFAPDPETVRAGVVRLGLEGGLPDGQPPRLFVLSASGESAVAGGGFRGSGNAAWTRSSG